MNSEINLSRKIGLPPGTLIHIGTKKTDKLKIEIIDFGGEEFNMNTLAQPDQCYPTKDHNTVRWINVNGLHDVEAISNIGKQLNLHDLLLEDVLNTNQRPKFEEFDSNIFISIKMLGLSADRNAIVSEQISVVLGDNWLISFQEQEGDLFDVLRERLRLGKGIIRQRKADYIFYRLIDIIVDNYFFITEYFSEAIELLEDKVQLDATQEVFHQILHHKKLLINFKRSVLPLREIIISIQKDSDTYIQEGTVKYLRDVFEHVSQIHEIIETQRELLSSIMDQYHSAINNKMNRVMQVLTIIATIFIPLTFIAGIYGMNFEYMPELKWRYGYFYVLGFMFVLLILMIFQFKRKRWL